MSIPTMTKFVLPYTRRELPGWGHLLPLARFADESRWAHAPKRTIRGKWHGLKMELDLTDSFDRCTYFLGRYYDGPSQLLLRALLKPNDLFVDVGANTGMISLHAASVVGRGGAVIAIEPNPEMVSKLRHNLAINRIDHVTVYEMGLSNEVNTLTLSVPQGHPGAATFARVNPNDKYRGASRYEVRIMPGDAVLRLPSAGYLTVKIDVEGFECRVLQGMSKLLSDRTPAVLTEVEPSWLERAGSNVCELYELMTKRGYIGYNLGSQRVFTRYRLSLNKLSGPSSVCETDVLWLWPGGEHEKRLAVRGLIQK